MYLQFLHSCLCSCYPYILVFHWITKLFSIFDKCVNYFPNIWGSTMNNTTDIFCADIQGHMYILCPRKNFFYWITCSILLGNKNRFKKKHKKLTHIRKMNASIILIDAENHLKKLKIHSLQSQLAYWKVKELYYLIKVFFNKNQSKHGT